MRTVSTDVWKISERIDPERRLLLLDEVSPARLVTQLTSAAVRADEKLAFEWSGAIDPDAPTNSFRIVAQIPTEETLFDQLFNGRCGYRAQYYLSVEEGELFNRQILDALEESIVAAGSKTTGISPSLIQASLRAPYSKIWAFEEQKAFDTAMPDTLIPARWVENGAGRGTRLPVSPCFDLKGTFIQPNGEPWIDELKLDRSNDLHRKGYT